MDHFPQPLQFEVLESAHKKLRVKLLAPFTYVDEIEGRPIKIEVKESFDTDFNSVPQGLWNLFPPTAYPEAGVVHD